MAWKCAEGDAEGGPGIACSSLYTDYCTQSYRGTVLSEACVRLGLVETLDKGKCNYIHRLTLLQSMGSQEDDSGNKPSSYS